MDSFDFGDFEFRLKGGVLPSARRPAHIEEEKKKEEEVKKYPPIKVKINRSDLFISSMIQWYEELSAKRKKELTSFELKRKAVIKSEDIYRCPDAYNKLPPNWVTLLRERGMVLRDEMKREQKKKRQLEEVKNI